MFLFIQKILRQLEHRFWESHRSSVAPGIFQHDYLHNLALYRCIKENFSVVRKNSKKKKYAILDVGCGHKPYYSLFKPFCTKYIGVDIDPELADIVARGEKIPFDNASFDLVVSFQTLEHCQQPQKVISEIYRVLKSGGAVILSTHGAWMHHPSPHDYYRWTSEGLAEIFKNFSNVSIKPNLKAPASLLQLINVELYSTACRHTFVKLPIYLIIILFNIIGKLIMPYGQDHFTINYIVLAQK